MKAVLVTLLGAILFYLSQGLEDNWALAWLAPAPLLWLAYRPVPRWQVLLTSLVAFAAGQTYLVQCYWGQIPPLILIPIVAVMSAAFAIAVGFSGEAFRRGSSWAALLAFPALWTTLEFTIANTSPHGSFGALGYAEVHFPAGIQIAALFGVHAVTFVLCLFANAVALLLRRQFLTGGTGVAVCTLAIAFGLVRLGEPGGPRVRVEALTNVKTGHHEHTLAAEEAVTQAYAAHIEGLKGVSIVAIPEGAVQMQAGDSETVLAPLAAAAKASGAMVVVGTLTPEPIQNRAFAFLPQGTVKTYEKRHLLLPFETEAPGREPGLLGGGYATQICKDMDFAGTVRTTAEHGVRLMIVPANDFRKDGWIHARMAIMRGVENGFAVLRSADNGLETVSDAQGRILASASTTEPGVITAEVEVPLGPGPTLYTRIGDVFCWLCAVLSVALCAFLGRPRIQLNASPHFRII